jgi:branched-subunit amino acid ABC-type transport system permease component
MSSGEKISILGLSILLMYGISRLLEFNGIGINMYGSYVVFYVFMLVSSLVLVPGMKV